MVTGVVQTVSVVGQVATRSGVLDYVSLGVGFLVGIGTVAVAIFAFRATRSFQHWQREHSEPFPVVTDLAVTRVLNTKPPDGDLIEDGYSSAAYVFNGGEAPLVIRIAKLVYHYGPDGKAGFQTWKRFGTDPLLIRGGEGSKICFHAEKKATWKLPEWPESVSLLLLYISGRDTEGYFRTWKLLGEVGSGSSPNTRRADIDRLTEIDLPNQGS